MKKKVSIMIPAYNEERSIPLLYAELTKLANENSEYDWEFLFVNDGSRDATLQFIRRLRTQDERVCYVDLSRNFGKENAMLAGFDHATGDCMIIMDADLQHPPHVVPEMLKKWEQGFDDVYARRLTRGKEPWLRKQYSLLYYRLLQKTTRIEVLPNVGDFRLLDKRCVNVLRGLRENERYTKGMYCWIGFRKTYVDFQPDERAEGQSSWGFFSLLSLAVEGIVSFTTAPLRFVTFSGFLVSAVGFLYFIYVLCKTLLYGDPVAGYPTLVLIILFLGGIQLIALGIIGEYLGRVFKETKNRPAYIAREYNGKLLHEDSSEIR